jgi:drug/metabolite transporter (DMT)-like permease
MIPSKKSLDSRAMAIVVGLCFLWGLAQVSIKVANRGVSPIFQAAVRSVVAGLLVALWAWSRGLPLVHRDRTLFHGLMIGLLFGTEFVFIYLGRLHHASAVILYRPFFVALGTGCCPASRSRGGSSRAWFWPCRGHGDSLGQSRAATRLQIMGDLMSTMGGFLWAATSLYLKRVVRSSMTPSQMLFYQLGVSAVQLSLMSLLLESRRILDLSPLVVGSLGYQAVIVAFASYLGWFWLIQVYPVSNLSGFTFFTPIFGVLLGGLLLHEPLTTKLLTGGGLVTGGMILVNWPESWGR